MEGFLRLGFFSMAEKVTKALVNSLPYIITASVIAGIWIYFLFLVPRKAKRYDNFLDYLSDILNFRVMMTSALAKILYIALALVLIVIGFVAMFAANFLIGLIGTIILEIILRVMFEFVMVFFSLQENVVFLREKKEEQDDYIYDDDYDE